MDSSDDDWDTPLNIQIDPNPVKPTKRDNITQYDYKEWIKERKEKGKQRFDRKSKSFAKRGIN
jgi:hypothetical protein